MNPVVLIIWACLTVALLRGAVRLTLLALQITWLAVRASAALIAMTVRFVARRTNAMRP